MEIHDDLTKKGRRKKEQIIELAFQAFGKTGHFAFSLSSFAKAHRIPNSLILYYFDSVETLFEEVVFFSVRKGQVLAQSYLQKAEPGPPSVIAWVESMFDWIALDASVQGIMMQFYCETRFNPKLGALNAEVIRVGKERIEAILLAGIQAGALQFAGSEEHAVVARKAEVLHDLLTGAVVKVLSNPAGPPSAVVRRRTVEACLEFLR